MDIYRMVSLLYILYREHIEPAGYSHYRF